MKGFEIADDQGIALEWLDDFMRGPEKMALLEGAAGTGKTTVAIQFAKQLGDEVLSTAPTHKATRVIKEKMPAARTTFSALGITPDIEREVIHYRQTNVFASDWNRTRLLLVDECSMVSGTLWKPLVELVRNYRVKVLYVGDFGQAPPVRKGERQIESCTFSLVPRRMALTQTRRFGSGIQELTDRVRRAVIIGANSVDLYPVPGAVEIYSDRVEFAGRYRKSILQNRYETRAVAWQNEDVDLLNQIALTSIHGDLDPRCPFVIGERVIAREAVVAADRHGNSDVRMYVDDEALVMGAIPVTRRLKEAEEFSPRGELQAVELKLRNLSEPGAPEFTATVLLPQSRKIFDVTMEKIKEQRTMRWSEYHNLKNYLFADLTSCYAMTVHRSQGSGFKEIFVAVDQFLFNKDPEAAMRLLYVAVSRGRERVVLLVQ